MASTQIKHAGFLPRLRFKFSSLKAPIRRVIWKLSVAYGHKSHRSLPGDIAKHDVVLAPAWPLPFEITNFEVARYLSRWDIVSLGSTVSTHVLATSNLTLTFLYDRHSKEQSYV